MKRKKIFNVFLILLILIISGVIYQKFFKKDQFPKTQSNLNLDEENNKENETFDGNTILDVNYISKDNDGNEYSINAEKGQVDLEDNNIIFLTGVSAEIRLKNTNFVKISSDFGKYNINNYDTIFSKNVLINYLDNKISGDYLEFSLEKNLMIISKNVIYTNNEGMLKTDVVEVNLLTKKIKMFMYENTKKININTRN